LSLWILRSWVNSKSVNSRILELIHSLKTCHVLSRTRLTYQVNHWLAMEKWPRVGKGRHVDFRDIFRQTLGNIWKISPYKLSLKIFQLWIVQLQPHTPSIKLVKTKRSIGHALHSYWKSKSSELVSTLLFYTRFPFSIELTLEHP
jgi:hypothetical protein